MPLFYFCSCALRERQQGRWRHQATVGGKQATVGGMGARRLLLVITSSHIFLLTIVSMVCRPNKPTKACTIAAKAIYMAARSSKSSGSCWSWWSPSWRCCGPPAASAGPPGYVGICIKTCTILLHYPFKFKSGGFCLHMKPSMKEQAPYWPALDGEGKSCIVLLYVQSIDYTLALTVLN
jgi:hypothetical protein